MSAWASENGIVMGQVKTEEKSNEITAIPELLDLLVVEGYVVTIDAMGTQKDIAKKISEKKAEYVLAVKENQPTLYKDIQDYFETALEDKTGDFEAEKDIELFAKAIRKHWGVEAMHWNLDVTFREDEMRSRKDYLPAKKVFRDVYIPRHDTLLHFPWLDVSQAQYWKLPEYLVSHHMKL